METLAERVTWALDNQLSTPPLSREDFATTVGTTYQAIWKVETGQTLNPRWIAKGAKALGLNVLWLLTGLGERRTTEVNGMQIHRAAPPKGSGDNFRVIPLDVKMREIPLINVAPAGSYCEAYEAALGNPGEHKLISCPVPCGPRSFWVRVVGRSMTAPSSADSYPEGSMVAFDADKEPVPGRPVIARLPTGECTLKNYEMEADGTPFLWALNPDWPDRRTPMPEGTEVCAAFICQVKV